MPIRGDSRSIGFEAGHGRDTYDAMRFRFKSTQGTPFSNWQNWNVGTYIKSYPTVSQSEKDGTGWHYYHYFGLTLPANQWVVNKVFKAPALSNSITAWGLQSSGFYPDTEWVEPMTFSGGVRTPIHYWDGLSRFYFTLLVRPDLHGSDYPYDVYLDDFDFTVEAGHNPYAYVKTAALAWNGVDGYALSFPRGPTVAEAYDIYSSVGSMKTNGLANRDIRADEDKPVRYLDLQRD